MSDATISMMVSHGTALVPTLINIATFPDIVSGAGKYPAYQRHMLDLHKRVHATIGKARDAGVPIYAGTDAGSGIVHGRIADEVFELTTIGMSPTEALGAASWDARKVVGPGAIEYSGIEHGAPADLVAFATDPRSDVRVLAAPDVVILRGQRY